MQTNNKAFTPLVFVNWTGGGWKGGCSSPKRKDKKKNYLHYIVVALHWRHTEKGMRREGADVSGGTLRSPNSCALRFGTLNKVRKTYPARRFNQSPVQSKMLPNVLLPRRQEIEARRSVSPAEQLVHRHAWCTRPPRSQNVAPASGREWAVTGQAVSTTPYDRYTVVDVAPRARRLAGRRKAFVGGGATQQSLMFSRFAEEVCRVFQCRTNCTSRNNIVFQTSTLQTFQQAQSTRRVSQAVTAWLTAGFEMMPALSNEAFFHPRI